MNLLFRKKKVALKAYTYQSCAFSNFPIARSHRFYPEWWKELPQTHTEQHGPLTLEYSTMRKCAGFVDNFKHGITIPLWSDVKIRVMENGEWVGRFADSSARPLESHPVFQYGSAFDHLIHIKFASPWIIVDEENTGTEFYMTGCFWNNPSMSDYFHTCPGITNFKYQNGVLINAFLSKTPREFLITAGTPMCQFIPLTERPIELKTELVKFEEWAQINDRFSAGAKFHTKYFTFKAIQQKQNKKGKCPFGFLHGKG